MSSGTSYTGRVISRRHFIGAAVTAASAAGVGAYTWLIEPHWLEIVRRPLPVRGLPPTLAGATLAQLTDVHVGPRVSDHYVLHSFSRIAALQPDIVVYTGDMTSYHADVFGHAERIYAHAPRGRRATLGILGNHDYGPNWAHPEIGAHLARIFAASGIHMLRNDVADVDGLQFVGMDDLWADAFDPARALRSLDGGRAAIALSHNPDTVDDSRWAGFDGWILSGHTHGGQCKPPFLPPPLLPVRNRRYTAGAFALGHNRSLYISRGIGHLLGVRFNVRPEVTLFTLQAA